MASGRILKTQISLSEQVNDLPLDAALLFTWMIPHADDFGRMCGSARKIKAQVVPMRDDFSAASVERCLLEMRAAQLIDRYEVSGELYIQFPRWEEHQSGLHKRTKSKIPDPPASEDSAPLPESPGISRNFPEFPSEQNRTEQEENGKRTELEAASAGAPTQTKPEPATDEDFDAMWGFFPKRNGGNPKQSALKAWNARKREGYTATQMTEGVIRYAVWCEATGKVGTEYVKQAASFFGPDKHFLESWEAPKQKPQVAGAQQPGARPETPARFAGISSWLEREVSQ